MRSNDRAPSGFGVKLLSPAWYFQTLTKHWLWLCDCYSMDDAAYTLAVSPISFKLDHSSGLHGI
jgi:hypothetical protein